MFRWRLSSLLGILGLLIPSVALACLWDYDTLMMERERFPDTLDLITGKFLRHSTDFYYWRIQDRFRRDQIMAPHRLELLTASRKVHGLRTRSNKSSADV